MSETSYGYCQCGCGGKTTVSVQNHPAFGWVKGEPKQFLRGHNNRGRVLKPTRYRVEDRGHTTPCWIWQLSFRGRGYGIVHHRGQRHPAHRFYYENRYGPVPEGLVLDHLCSNVACVNPDHLEPVTHAENCHRGRGTRLTIEDVREIRQRLRAGERGRDLAPRFGVSEPTISDIKHRRKWADV